jgi:hypothetical protein
MSVWPSPAQDLLLQAALMPDERAGRAWARIRPEIDIDSLDAGTAAVLPALRRNLVSHGVEDELLSLFKGVQRHTWARTQLLLAPLLPVVAAVQDAGLPTLLLKGGAFIADTRLSAGMRAMNDLDVLVPHDRRGDAVEVLLGHGLLPVDGMAPWHVIEHVPRYSPSYAFRDELDRQLDLHWHVLHSSRQPDADDDFWAAAVPIELLGVRTLALCPADELLLVMLHGLRWSPEPGFRWVIDAALLAAGTFGPVDYERLVEQARRRRVTAAVHAALTYLRRVADAPVPPDVLRRLRRPLLERLELRAQTTAPRRRSRFSQALLLHEQRLRRELSLGRRPTPARRLRTELTRRGTGPGRPAAETAAAVGPRPPGAAAIELGQPLDFRRAEVVRSVVEHGTWRSEPDGCWIAGREARLVMTLPAPVSTALVLDLAAAPFIAPGAPRQRLRIASGPHAIAELDAREPVALSAVIPHEALAGRRELELRLGAPDAVSPARLGVGDEDRAISFHLKTLVLREPPLVADGERVAFGAGAADERFLVDGWYWAEDSGRWTRGSRARLLLRLPGVPRAAELELRAMPFAGRQGRVQIVDVHAGGRHAATLRYDGNAAGQVRRIALGPGHFGAAGDLVVELRPRAPRSPLAEGVGPDRRPLGLCLEALTLRAQALAHS